LGAVTRFDLLRYPFREALLTTNRAPRRTRPQRMTPLPCASANVRDMIALVRAKAPFG